MLQDEPIGFHGGVGTPVFVLQTASQAVTVKRQLLRSPPEVELIRQQECWWAHQDLNLEPTDYESAALTN